MRTPTLCIYSIYRGTITPSEPIDYIYAYASLIPILYTTADGASGAVVNPQMVNANITRIPPIAPYANLIKSYMLGYLWAMNGGGPDLRISEFHYNQYYTAIAAQKGTDFMIQNTRNPNVDQNAG